MMLRSILFALLLALPLFGHADGGSDLIRVSSIHDVNTTMDKLEKLVVAKGLSVIARINHQAAAEKAGLALSPVQVLIFGNPSLGTPLMQDNPASGLDLPLRIAAYEDKEGSTQMVYHNPMGLAAAYGLNKNPTLKKMAGALKALTSKAGM